VTSTSERGWNGSNYEDPRWGLASMFTTSLMTWNCLKYLLLRPFQRYLHFTSLFLRFLMDKLMKPYFVIIADLSQIALFYSALSLEKKSVTPIYFLKKNENCSLSSCWKKLENYHLNEEKMNCCQSVLFLFAISGTRFRKKSITRSTIT